MRFCHRNRAKGALVIHAAPEGAKMWNNLICSLFFMVSFADWKHHLPGFLVSFLLLYSCCPFCSVAAAAASAVPPNEPFFTATVWLYASTSLPKRCGNTKIFIHPPKSQSPPEPLYLSKDEAGSSPHMHLHSRGQGRQGWSGKTMHSRQTWHEQNRSASPSVVFFKLYCMVWIEQKREEKKNNLAQDSWGSTEGFLLDVWGSSLTST